MVLRIASLRRRFLAGVMFALVGPAGLPAAPVEAVSVVLDEAKLMKLPERVATIIVGNPLIADVTLQPGGLMVLTGKGYGITNLLVLDRAGAVLLERTIKVEGPRDQLVVYRGAARESYSCSPICERRITLGDSKTYFDETLAQSGQRTSEAQGGTAAAAK